MARHIFFLVFIKLANSISLTCRSDLALERGRRIVDVVVIIAVVVNVVVLEAVRGEL